MRRKREREEPQEKEDNLTTPTVYSYYKSATVTETFSMGREKLGCSRKKKCLNRSWFRTTRKLTYYNRSTSMDRGSPD
jgi:hypothetical protein